MRTLHWALPCIQWRRQNLADVELLHPDDSTNNIDNRVDRSDFMEMNFIDFGAVYFGLGFADSQENFDGIFDYRFLELGAFK